MRLLSCGLLSWACNSKTVTDRDAAEHREHDRGGSDWAVGALLRINWPEIASREEFEVGARRVPGVEPGLSRWAV